MVALAFANENPAASFVFDLRTHPFELRHLLTDHEYERHTPYGSVSFASCNGGLFIGGSKVKAMTVPQGGLVDSPPSIAFMSQLIDCLGEGLTLEMLAMLQQHPEELIPQEFWGKKLLGLGSVYKRRGGRETFYLLYHGPDTKPSIAQVDLFADWTKDYLVPLVEHIEEQAV